MADLPLETQEAIRKAASVLTGEPDDYIPLQRMLRNKSFVLLGEATHGTHDFYQARVMITKQLITEHGLSAIAIEGDWPSAFRVNRYVRWQGGDQSADEALSDFRRFPMWMWRNTVVQEFVDWLREHNRGLPPNRQVGFYGLDMYSLYESAAAVVEYLEQVDPGAARLARQRYGCLEHASDERHYGYGVTLGRQGSCEDEVVKQLQDLRNKAFSYIQGQGMTAEDELFQAEQNARLVQSAEAYYRQMFSSRINTWNLRDSHMSETLDNLHLHLSRQQGHSARIAVWAHNSHLGDARATDMGRRGEHNVGQLARQRYANDCVLVGLTTYRGTVSASSDWDGLLERDRVRLLVHCCIVDSLYRTRLERFFLPLQGALAERLRESRLQRAIGVLYLPESERASHYFRCLLADQFDVVLHFDETRALEPLDSTSEWVLGEEETYPFGL